MDWEKVKVVLPEAGHSGLDRRRFLCAWQYIAAKRAEEATYLHYTSACMLVVVLAMFAEPHHFTRARSLAVTIGIYSVQLVHDVICKNLYKF